MSVAEAPEVTGAQCGRFVEDRLVDRQERRSARDEFAEKQHDRLRNGAMWILPRIVVGISVDIAVISCPDRPPVKVVR